MKQSVTKAVLSAVLSAAVAIPALAAEYSWADNGSYDLGADDTLVISGNLSPRELEVLKYLALGKTFEEIAIICGVGTETVKTHTKNLRAKLDAPTSIAAVSRAYELGILRP